MDKYIPLTKDAVSLELQTSCFFKDTWRITSGDTAKGITEIIECMFTPFKTTKNGKFYYQKKNHRNRLRDLSINGLYIYHFQLKGAEDLISYEALQKLVKLFFFLPETMGLDITKKFFRLFSQPKWTKSQSIILWNSENVHLKIGMFIDQNLKDIFTLKISRTIPLGIELIAQNILDILNIVPITGDLKVASLKKEFMMKIDHIGENASSACEICTKSPTVQSITAIDLVGFSPTEKLVYLLEMKTFKGEDVDEQTLRKYNLQIWLSWLMFNLTFPKIHPGFVKPIIVVLLPAIGVLHFFNVSSPPVTKNLLNNFKFLKFICNDNIKYLTPAMARPKIKGPFKSINLLTGMVQVAPKIPGEKMCTRKKRKIK